MYNKFKTYRTPSNVKLAKLLKNSLLIFDTNVLLNLYRFQDKTVVEFLDILTNIKDRIWLPHQVLKEYFNNKENVLKECSEEYETLLKTLDKMSEELKATKKKIETPVRHPHLKYKFIDPLLKKINTAKTEIKSKKKKYGKKNRINSIETKLKRILADNIGPNYSNKQLKEIVIEGQFRFTNLIPPGFKDSHKNGIAKYGDLILWFQILDKAKIDKRSIILVSDDNKSDWWNVSNGNQLPIPRPELIEEFCEVSSNGFFMLNSVKFLELAKKHLSQNVSDKSIEDAIRVREETKEEMQSKESKNLKTSVQSENTLGKIELANLFTIMQDDNIIHLQESIKQAEANLSNHPIVQLLKELNKPIDKSNIDILRKLAPVLSMLNKGRNDIGDNNSKENAGLGN